MKVFTVKERSLTYDTYKQQDESFSDIRDIEVDVCILSNSVRYDYPQFKDATHLGLTTDSSLTNNMILVNDDKIYRIESVNNIGRLAQLILKEE